MLKALVRHPRQPLSRDKLAQLARGREFEPFDRSLDVQISRLRKMIEPDPAQPRYIQTVWGVGYVFVPDGANCLGAPGHDPVKKPPCAEPVLAHLLPAGPAAGRRHLRLGADPARAGVRAACRCRPRSRSPAW
jgi:hypothetical protein